MTKLDLKKLCGRTLLPFGFQKTKDSWTWASASGESTLVFNLQKSDYGDQYYMNLGVWFRAIAEAPLESPKEELCHLRMRLCRLVGESLRLALDLEDLSLSDDVRQSIIVDSIIERGVPFLRAHATLPEVRLRNQAGQLKGMAVHRVLYYWLRDHQKE